MKIHSLSIAILVTGLLSPVAHTADYPGPLQVSFRTTDCNGATGLANVPVDRVGRIQPHDCPNGRKLKQLLTRGTGMSEAYLLAEEDAVKLEGQIQRIMDSRQKALEQSRPVIINR